MKPARAASIATCLAAAIAVLSLTGCASVTKLFQRDDPAAAAVAAKPAVPVYRLEVQAPSDVRALLLTYLDLARFQSAPESEDITPAEVDRLIAAAPAQVRSLLETEGYFNAEVKVARASAAYAGSAAASAAASSASPASSASAASAPSAVPIGNAASAAAAADSVPSPGELPLVQVQVTPGPRAMVDHFEFTARGPLQQAADGGDLKAKVLLAQVRNGWQLPPEYAFRQSQWRNSKNIALAKLRADGYPAATLADTSARVDADANTVALDVVAESGELYHLGPLRISGLSRYDEATVRKLSTLRLGDAYRESLLIDFQERLQKAGLFEGASVVLDVEPDTAQAAPVVVQVRELPLQQATLGAGYSANTGPRLTFEHTHRQPFGQRWIAKNKFELGPKLRSWNGELTSYPLDGLYRNLIAGSAERLETVSEVRTSWHARMGRTQDTQRIERLYFVEVTHARLETTSDRGRTVVDNDAVSGNYHWVYRDLDSVLLPTDGYSVSAQAAAGYARSGGTENNGPFARAYARYTEYWPLGSNWFATARIEGGQVFADNAVGIPDTLLFRAGGDDSVRGYAYRSLGPRVKGALLSGRVLLAGSAEIAHPLFASKPSLWGAAFIDAGNAATRWQDWSPAMGYGVGLRWRSPVGPLRMDVAYGQKVDQLRFHLSVGIAF
jgi:translocation and assembly module TamA